jgi:hypothetical protein
MLVHETALMPDAFDGALMAGDPGLAEEIWGVLYEATRTNLPANVMVADLHKNRWKRQVLERLDDGSWPDAPRSRRIRSDLMAFLNRLDDQRRLVRHSQPGAPVPTDDRGWLALALQASTLDSIVAARPGVPPVASGGAPVIPLADLRASEPWNARQTSADVPMSRSGYDAVLRPLLRHARKVKLIDPYLAPHDDKRWCFVELAALRMKEPWDQCRLEIHTKPHGPTPATSLREWVDRVGRFKTASGARHTVRICLWEERTEPRQRFHNRHLLSDQWGVRVGSGFLCERDGTVRRDNWDLISEAAREQTWWQYDVDPSGEARLDSPFALVGFEEIIS